MRQAGTRRGQKSIVTIPLGLLILLILPLLIGCGKSEPAESLILPPPSANTLTGEIEVTGSTAMRSFSTDLADAFQEQNPGVYITINGGRIEQGFAALINGTTEIAMTDREMNALELDQYQSLRGSAPVKRLIATEGIAVVTNKLNPLINISTEQLRDIFQEGGRFNRWSQLTGAASPANTRSLGAITVYLYETRLGTLDHFQKSTLNGTAFRSSAARVHSDEELFSRIAENINGIGLCTTGLVDRSRVNVLEIDGVFASPETIQNRQYPLLHDFFFYYNREAPPLTRLFVAFAGTPEGAAILDRHGLIPPPIQ